MNQMTILECNLRNLADAYGEAYKLGGLRIDTVGMMLNEANIGDPRRVMVFDHSTGFLTAAVLMRLRKTSPCYFLSDRKGVSFHIANQSNLGSLENLHHVPVELVSWEGNLEKTVRARLSTSTKPTRSFLRIMSISKNRNWLDWI